MLKIKGVCSLNPPQAPHAPPFPDPRIVLHINECQPHIPKQVHKSCDVTRVASTFYSCTFYTCYAPKQILRSCNRPVRAFPVPTCSEFFIFLNFLLCVEARNKKCKTLQLFWIFCLNARSIIAQRKTHYGLTDKC